MNLLFSELMFASFDCEGPSPAEQQLYDVN